jgi:hypothetical protein
MGSNPRHAIIGAFAGALAVCNPATFLLFHLLRVGPFALHIMSARQPVRPYWFLSLRRMPIGMVRVCCTSRRDKEGR